MANNDFSFTENIRNELVSVGTSVVILSERREGINKRVSILIRNTSPNVTDIITVAYSTDNTPISASNGIVLRQFESFTDSTDNGYTAFQGKILAVCVTATGTVSILER